MRWRRFVRNALIIVTGVALILPLVWTLLPSATLVQRTTGYLDMHVHTAGMGYGDSGAFVNAQMADSYKFPIYLWAMGVSESELIEHGDGVVIRKLADAISDSQRVSSAIILAMDGVIDEHGKLDRQRTQIYVPNQFVAREVARYANLEFGASINPNRKDAIPRLRAVKAQGAKLVKWIPNIMHIDPANPDHEPFYLEMARLGLPLLSHTGQERSFSGARDEYGDPRRLSLALQSGVTVIAAHIATTGANEGTDNFARIMPMFEQYPNLYTEISSLTQVNKLNYLASALENPDVTERMLYGTDWPLQFFPLVSPLYHLNHIDLGIAKSISRIDNVWDTDVALKEALGVPEAVFERSRKLLNMD